MNGAAAGAAAAAAIAQAIKASGAIVRVQPEGFQEILRRQKDPLVIHAHGGFLSKSHQYLTSYKGFAFFAKSPSPIELPGSAEVMEARSIWIPA